MAKIGDEISVNESETNQVDVINISSGNVRFEIEGNRYALKPGHTVPLHKAYALSRSMQKGKDPVPSTVELLTAGQVIAVSDPRARHMLQAAKR